MAKCYVKALKSICASAPSPPPSQTPRTAPDRKEQHASRHRPTPPRIAAICQRYGIRRLEVFGSAARASDFDPAHSDADFLVEFAPGVEPGLHSIFGAKADLEALLGRGVDLVEPGAVRNPYVLANINRHRVIIFSDEYSLSSL